MQPLQSCYLFVEQDRTLLECCPLLTIFNQLAQSPNLYVVSSWVKASNHSKVSSEFRLKKHHSKVINEISNKVSVKPGARSHNYSVSAPSMRV